MNPNMTPTRPPTRPRPPPPGGGLGALAGPQAINRRMIRLINRSMPLIEINAVIFKPVVWRPMVYGALMVFNDFHIESRVIILRHFDLK